MTFNLPVPGKMPKSPGLPTDKCTGVASTGAFLICMGIDPLSNNCCGSCMSGLLCKTKLPIVFAGEIPSQGSDACDVCPVIVNEAPAEALATTPSRIKILPNSSPGILCNPKHPLVGMGMSPFNICNAPSPVSSAG